MSENKHFDFLSAIVLIVLAAAILIGSLSIGREAGEVWYLSPGLMPGVLGAALLLCSILQLVSSLKDGGAAVRWAETHAWAKATFFGNPVTVRMLVGVALMAVYTFVLMHFFSFWLASLLFMIALLLYLKAAKPVKALLFAGCAVGLIVLLFQAFFRVPLP